jgi:hypothetical protein
MQRFLFNTLIVSSGALVLLTGYYLLSTPSAEQYEEEFDFARAQELLEQGYVDEAIPLIMSYQDKIEEQAETAFQWLDLLVAAHAKKGEVAPLLSLYQYSPDTFLHQEEAALLVANHQLTEGQLPEFQYLRDYWKGYERKEDCWFCLDADKLIKENRKQEAYRFLQSKSFYSEADAARLIRLSRLSEPKDAWSFLVQAQKKDPYSIEVRKEKALLLESMDNKEAALIEYRDLAALKPQDQSLKKMYLDQLLKNGDYKIAQDLLKDDLDENMETLLFLSRVAYPSALLDNLKAVKNTLDSTFATYQLTLPQGQFWDNDLFNKVVGNKQFLKSSKEATWMRTLSALKRGSDKEAWILLHTPPLERDQTTKDLQDALKHLLVYRGVGELEIDEEIEETDDPLNLFSYLKTLAKRAQPGQMAMETSDEIDTFLHSFEGISAVLLKAGWNEAALAIYPFNYPNNTHFEWMTTLLVNALNDNRGPRAALEFAATLYPKEGLNEPLFEIITASKLSEKRNDDVQNLARQNSEIGFQVAKMVAEILLENGKLQGAKRTIALQNRLNQSTLGQELLARIALSEGDTLTADRIYYTLRNDSLEAKSYIAKKAYKDRDWQTAKVLTEELLAQFPENETLKQNHARIQSHASQ